jgi:hypothetical protein
VTYGAGCELCDGCDIYGAECGIFVMDNIDIYIYTFVVFAGIENKK